jgi:DNA-directed RNA polymerase specialized sigma24 family protein
MSHRRPHPRLHWCPRTEHTKGARPWTPDSLLLERLSPLERAAFVLRDVFGFGF